MNIRITPAWRVHAQSDVLLHAPATAVWGQIRNVRWFLTRDPLHSAVRRLDPAYAASGWANARLLISHRVLGVGPDRLGRVLAWRENVGYAVSDLSRHNPHQAFPHICAFRLKPIDERSCRLIILAKGVWTATWMPRWLVRMWLGWVLAATHARLIAELGDFARWHTRLDAALNARP